jgi:hypothetical protein
MKLLERCFGIFKSKTAVVAAFVAAAVFALLYFLRGIGILGEAGSGGVNSDIAVNVTILIIELVLSAMMAVYLAASVFPKGKAGKNIRNISAALCGLASLALAVINITYKYITELMFLNALGCICLTAMFLITLVKDIKKKSSPEKTKLYGTLIFGWLCVFFGRLIIGLIEPDQFGGQPGFFGMLSYIAICVEVFIVVFVTAARRTAGGNLTTAAPGDTEQK